MLNEVGGSEDGEARVFAREVGRKPEDVVGTYKGVKIAIADFVLTGVLMRLVDDNEAFFGAALELVKGDGDSSGDFLWVVSVVGINAVG